MPQLFTLLITVPLMKTGPKRSLTAETGSRQLCLDSSVEAAELIAQTVRGADPKHRMRQSPSQSYSSEKPYSWQVHFVSAYQQCAMLSKRLKKTVACCYETYRMRREGKVESPLHFFLVYCRDILTMITKTQRMQRGQRMILQPCWCKMPLLLKRSSTTTN